VHTADLRGSVYTQEFALSTSGYVAHYRYAVFRVFTPSVVKAVRDAPISDDLNLPSMGEMAIGGAGNQLKFHNTLHCYPPAK